MEAGNKHEYTGVECKKEISVERGNDADEGEKEVEGRDNIFGRVKQIDSHAVKVGFGGVVCIVIRRRR